MNMLVIGDQKSLKIFRGFRSSFLFVVVLTMVIVTGAELVQAHEPGTDKFWESAPLSMRGGPMRVMASRLDLSDEQQSTIRNILDDSREEGRVMQERVHEVRQQISESIRANGYQEDELRFILDNSTYTNTDMILIRARTMAAIYEILEPEQQSKVDALLLDGLPMGPPWKRKMFGGRPF